MPEEAKISEAELDQLHRIEDKIQKVTATLIRIMPDAHRDMLTTVAASLCDFWQLADNHRLHMWELLQLSGPQDKAKLSELLGELVHADIIAHLPNHVENMEQLLPGPNQVLLR